MPPITNHLPTADLQALDAAHHMHPFTTNDELGDKGARIITRAKGIYLTDSEGNEILDAMAGLWCVNLGPCDDACALVAQFIIGGERMHMMRRIKRLKVRGGEVIRNGRHVCAPSICVKNKLRCRI